MVKAKRKELVGRIELPGIELRRFAGGMTSDLFFGLVGVFNPDIIDRVDVYLGAFPIEWGRFLSSIVQIIPKQTSREGSFNFDIANSSLFYGARILPKTSLFISYRRTYYDLLAEPLIEMPLPNYYDTQLRLGFIFQRRIKNFLLTI